MLSRLGFPLRGAFLLTGLLLCAAAAAPARAQNVLRGPHPLLADNDASVHLLVGQGLGSSSSGPKLALDYGYHITGPAWLALSINMLLGGCAGAAACDPSSGSAVEVLGGAKWKMVTPIPLVPYGKAQAGLVYLFPEGATSAFGLTLRGGGGATYFVFDWLGFSAEVGLSLGYGYYDYTFPGSHTYAVVDFGGGVEFQF